MLGRRTLLFLASAGATIIIGLFLAYLFRDDIIRYVMKPGQGFEMSQVPAPPDYADAGNWAARPDKADGADLTPATIEGSDNQSAAQVDVFFVHPTTYIDGSSWNADLSAKLANRIVDEAVLPNQASVFNGTARVYAPRYRQATLYAFMDSASEDSHLARDLAYADVAAAFEHYLTVWNGGRPFFLAGHSQGSFHLLRLLEEYADDPRLKAQMIAAYPIGYPAPRSLFDGALAPLTPCIKPAQTGCVVSYNSISAEGGSADYYTKQLDNATGGRYVPVAGQPLSCVNPLTWDAAVMTASESSNLGSVPFAENPREALPEPVPGLVAAECRDGILYVTEPDHEGFGKFVLPGRNYHVYDYNLFYMNLRDNIARRAEAYLRAR